VTYDRPEHERRAEGLHHSETLARQRDRCHQRRHAGSVARIKAVRAASGTV